MAYYFTRPEGPRADVILHTVKREQLFVTVTEKGTLESAKNRDIVCRVRAGNKGYATTINEVIPDGTRVKRGQKLMTLDDSALKDQEDAQIITVKQAAAAAVKAEKEYQIVKEQTEGAIALARDTVENTRIELEKYTGTVYDPNRAPYGAVAGATATLIETGLFRQTLDDLNGQIALAQANVEQNRERSDWARRMVKLSYMSPAQAQSEKSRLDSSLEDLRSKLAKRDQLINYDRRQQLTVLRGVFDDAQRKLRQAELEAEAKQATAKTEWETSMDLLAQQQEKLADIRRQRKECEIYAPMDIKDDSMVVYFKPEGNRFGQSSQGLIEQGAQVKEGQKMLRIPNLDEMQVNTKVHEAMVSRIKIGQRATIKVDALPDRQFVGSVAWKSAVANQTDSWISDVKLYQTIVRVDGELGPDGQIIPLAGEILNPDMTAEVTINVDATPHPVLTVPMQSIIGGAEMGATREVFVKNPASPTGYERRPVVLGLYNEKMVEIRSGLQEGDEVVTNPKVLLTDAKTKTRDAEETGNESKDTEKNTEKSPNPQGVGYPGGGKAGIGGAGPGGGMPGGGAPSGGMPGGSIPGGGMPGGTKGTKTGKSGKAEPPNGAFPGGPPAGKPSAAG